MLAALASLEEASGELVIASIDDIAMIWRTNTQKHVALLYDYYLQHLCHGFDAPVDAEAQPRTAWQSHACAWTPTARNGCTATKPQACKQTRVHAHRPACVRRRPPPSMHAWRGKHLRRPCWQQANRGSGRRGASAWRRLKYLMHPGGRPRDHDVFVLRRRWRTARRQPAGCLRRQAACRPCLGLSGR